MTLIIGTGSLQSQAATIGAATTPHTYLGVARNMMVGVRVLAAALPPPASALALVAAHVLECLLKAFLTRHRPGDELKTHNLIKLWNDALYDGLPVHKTPPAWVDCLNHLHNGPYYLRYSTEVHGIVTPRAEPMTSELSDLVEVVQQALLIIETSINHDVTKAMPASSTQR